MIKVIPKMKELDCSGCDSTLQFETTDVREGIISTDYLGGREKGRYIACPVCQKINVLKR